MRARRWSDHDHYFGPFTYARHRGDSTLEVMLSSGDDDDPGCELRFRVPGHALLIALPPILRPYREQKRATHRSPERIAELGEWWTDEHERQIGATLCDGGRFLLVRYGRQTGDSSTERVWGHFLGFRQWRHVRTSLYDTDGAHWWTEPSVIRGREAWREWRARQDACPSVSFDFDDYDGERIRARTKIEEREWLLGTGWFRWLSAFRGPMVRRSLDIDFSAEVGPRKGSWKGGTLGHGIDVLPGEDHEAAFRRYCDGHNLTFVGVVLATEAAS